MMNKILITVLIPVKNEERNLPHCLRQLDRFDQVIVIDSGSIDRTPQIAKEFGAEYYLFDWNGRFPKKRNWALRNLPIRNKWVLFLDADEVISDEFVNEIHQKTQIESIDGYWLEYKNYFMGHKLKYGDIFTKLALFRFGKAEYERIDEDLWSHLDMEVHEHPVVLGETGRVVTPIDHNDYKGLDAYIARHNAYSSWEAHRFLTLERNRFNGLTSRQKLKYRLMRTGLLPIFFFIGSYFLKLGFLDGIPGFYWASFKAHYFLQIQSKIRELKSV